MNVKVVSVFDEGEPQFYGDGEILHITPKKVKVKVGGQYYNFNRNTGLQVGFKWPYWVLAIQLDSLKIP